MRPPGHYAHEGRSRRKGEKSERGVIGAGERRNGREGIRGKGGKGGKVAKRYMVSGSLCPLISFLNVSYLISFVVRGQQPHRG